MIDFVKANNVDIMFQTPVTDIQIRAGKISAIDSKTHDSRQIIML